MKYFTKWIPITRLKGLRQKDFERLGKYCAAYVYLNN